MGKSKSKSGGKSKVKEKKSKSKKSSSKSSSKAEAASAAQAQPQPAQVGGGSSLDLSGNLQFEAGRIFGRYGVNGYVDKTAFKHIVQELESKVPHPHVPGAVAARYPGGGAPPPPPGALDALGNQAEPFESGYLFGQYASAGDSNGSAMSRADFERFLRDSRMQTGGPAPAPPHHSAALAGAGGGVAAGTRRSRLFDRGVGVVDEPPLPPQLPMPIVAGAPNFLATQSPANRVYGEQLNRKRQMLLRHCREVQALQYETRLRHQQVEDDIAAYFNELLDDLRSSEDEKNAALRELLDVCAHDIRQIDSIGARLQAAPTAVAARGSADAADLSQRMQRVLAKPVPAVNVSRFVNVPNRLADLLARAQRHDDLCAEVDRRGDELGRTLEEKQEVQSAQRQTAKEFNALRDKSAREIAQWVDLTDKLTDELEFARSEVLRLEALTAGIAEAAQLNDVQTIQALVQHRADD